MKKNIGFTLIEIMVVIAVIGLLAAIILTVLNSARSKGNDARIKSQLKSMIPQAQLFKGAMTGVAYVIADPVTPSDITAGTNLFNDSNSTNYGLYNLLKGLPGTTKLYYGWDGKSPLTGGKWFVIATTSNGAVGVDYTSTLRSVVGTPPSTVAGFTDAAFFPNATIANGYGVQGTTGGTPPPASYRCSDGVDNDRDSYIDEEDPNCHIGGDLRGIYMPDHDAEDKNPK